MRRKASPYTAALEIARAAIDSAAQLLAGGGPDDLDLELALEDVERAARHLRAIIDEALEEEPEPLAGQPAPVAKPVVVESAAKPKARRERALKIAAKAIDFDCDFCGRHASWPCVKRRTSIEVAPHKPRRMRASIWLSVRESLR